MGIVAHVRTEGSGGETTVARTWFAHDASTRGQRGRGERVRARGVRSATKCCAHASRAWWVASVEIALARGKAVKMDHLLFIIDAHPRGVALAVPPCTSPLWCLPCAREVMIRSAATAAPTRATASTAKRTSTPSAQHRHSMSVRTLYMSSCRQC